MHYDLVAGQLVSGQLAGVGHKAVLSGSGGTLLLPGGEGLGLVNTDGVLDPEDHLGHRHEVHLGVVLQHFIHPVEESVQEFWVVLQPGGVEEKAEGSSVLVKVSVEVVGQEVVELIPRSDVGAGVHHGTSGQVLVHGGVLPPVQLVDNNLPDGERTGRTILKVAVTSVGHSEVQGIRPQGRVLQGGRDGGVVEEALFLHHGELVVTTNSQIRRSQTDHRIVVDFGKLVNDQSGSGHLPGPVLHGGLRPEGFITVVSDGVGSDLVTQSVHVLYRRVVGVVVRHEECTFDITSVGIPPLLVEDFTVQVNVSNIDGVVEGECDHLRDSVTPVVLRAEIAGHLSSILRAEAVRKLAESFITRRSSVWIILTVYSKVRYITFYFPDSQLTTDVLIRTIITFLHSVTEEPLGNTGAVSARQLVGVLTERLVRYQQRLYLFLFCLFITIFHSPLPITGLLFEIKSKTWWTSDGLETLRQSRDLDMARNSFLILNGMDLNAW